MRGPVRILIVDDSSMSRRVLKLAIEEDPRLRVIGEVGGGAEALTWLERSSADVVAMDAMMEGMSGIEATRRIRERFALPVVVVTAASSAAMAFEAVRAGAVDVLRKPRLASKNADPELARLRSILWLAAEKAVHAVPLAAPAVAPRAASPLASGSGNNLVVIGASCGGPPALATVLAGLGALESAAVVVAQHIEDSFVDPLAEWLGKECGRAVQVTRSRTAVHPGNIYLAGALGDTVLESGNLVPVRANDDNPRPWIDRLFNSVAERRRAGTLVGVLLTGMGSDGAAGLQAIRAAGGTTIVQDEATSAIFGMPRAAIACGAADVVAPLGEVAARVRAILGERCGG